jgi:isoleucyl-tRNA synthetase
MSSPSSNGKRRFHVSLPSTSVPMRPVAGFEEHALAMSWGVEAPPPVPASPRPRAVLQDGPPYANGPVHMGHAVNKVLKDAWARAQAALGHDVRFQWGWDCHGLPVEWKVEESFRAQGLSRAEVGVWAMRQACRAHAAHWVAEQAKGFAALGVRSTGEPYTTMAFASEAAVARAFLELVDTGVVERAPSPVRWSPVEGTALAEAELEWEERPAWEAWVVYPVVGGPLQGANLVVWTTTPWTLPVSAGVACGPSVAYGLFQTPDGRRWVAADACADRVAEVGGRDWVRVGCVDVATLTASTLRHPLSDVGQAWGGVLPVVLSDHVSPDQGSGLVHMAPAHGPEDFVVGRALGWEVVNAVDTAGRVEACFAPFNGLEAVSADGRGSPASAAVVAALEEHGLLWARSKARHEVAVSWRSKCPVLYRSAPQWFARLDAPMRGTGPTLRAKALEVAATVRWAPASAGAKMAGMLRSRPDWLLSRQRAWGVPLALFVEVDESGNWGRPLRCPEVDARVLDAFAQEGADAWYAPGAKARFLGPDRDPSRFEQVMDVLDVWFESGVSHRLVAGPDGVWEVADHVVEGSDQHRGWFQASLLCGAALDGVAPFRACTTHGFVLDGKGKKMSKSVGNVVDPLETARTFGTDAVRWWVVASDTSVDARAGEASFRAASDAVRGLRNTLRFLSGVVGDGATTPPTDAPSQGPDRWLLAHAHAAVEGWRAAWSVGDASNALRLAVAFADKVGGAWAAGRKDALYCGGPRDPDRLSARATAWWARSVLWSLFQPVVPFTVFETQEGAGVRPLRLCPVPDTSGWAGPVDEGDGWCAARAAFQSALERERAAGGATRGETLVARTEAPLAWLAACVWTPPQASAWVGAAQVRATPSPTGAWSVQVEPAPGGLCPCCRVVHEVVEDDLCTRCAQAQTEWGVLIA